VNDTDEYVTVLVGEEMDLKNFNIEEVKKRMSKLEKKIESFKIEEEKEYLNVDFDFGEETLVEVIGRVE